MQHFLKIVAFWELGTLKARKFKEKKFESLKKFKFSVQLKSFFATQVDVSTPVLVAAAVLLSLLASVVWKSLNADGKVADGVPVSMQKE